MYLSSLNCKPIVSLMFKQITFALLLLTYTLSNAQLTEDLSFGVQLGTGKTMLSVADTMGLPSGASKIDDGQTSKVENISGRAIRFIVNYNLSEYIALSSGFHFTYKRLFIRNDDGSYIGGSVYTANYFHLPVLMKYTTNEVKDKVNIVITVGPVFDIKMGEDFEGSDYAHFMNLANNNHNYGPRERNGTNIPTSLFKSTGVSLFLGAGAQYRFSDSFTAYAGFSYQHSLYNILNPNLTYNDSNNTPISETMTWNAGMLLFDLGIGFSIN